MYYELAVLVKNVSKSRAFWKDGELWTAVVAGLVAGIWLDYHPAFIMKIREHFTHLLDVTSITFGFTLTALFFHIEAIGTWRDHETVRSIAGKLITSHVWTVICLLLQIGYILALWTLDGNIGTLRNRPRAIFYGLLVFQSIYCGCQILNHVLTAWWTFAQRAVLVERSNPQQGIGDDCSPARHAEQ
ncbi:hypothetical protein TA3x_001127 [Tundrisphaera sp. TA3]|uniref:hypothetical protein n=1 Tax=Tundrisphaera sp. TA3 TaxID=3435775 RepID=UPI003EB8C433